MTSIKLFEDQKIRTRYVATEEIWYFSVIDIIEVLTGSSIPKRYWSDLKKKLQKEGSQLYEKIVQLKFEASDGKQYATDCLSTENLLRLIQSIPSPKAEPFKVWLAKTGYERIEEIQDPEKSIDRAMENYLQLGYSKDWINQRLKSIEVRKELTDEWDERGVKKGQEYATLTDIITQAWSGKTVKNYKHHKGLKKENLRDNMTNLELVLNMLAEATTTEISKEKKPATFDDNKKIARQGGTIAGNTRKAIEVKTGKKIVTNLNAKALKENKKKGLS
ncbi:Bro-N domain-containing protein [Ferruginibacter sp.]|uniref:BRO-N domain-containing protein n=1 Tax=Ferruginibacter sp. TaxID=1940288 RepID=UPI00198F850D|nr:Bro-N domain-containing protein [Ferruginibacter sp.]MBC7628760.1 Bro-N domain-containing protein [Ferruginibacter sp.]